MSLDSDDTATNTSNVLNSSDRDPYNGGDAKLPTDPRLFKQFFHEDPIRIIRNFASILKGLPPKRQPRSLTTDEHIRLNHILKACAALDPITHSTEKFLQLKGLLSIVAGILPNTAWSFPEPEKSLAADTYDKFSAQNWGIPPSQQAPSLQATTNRSPLSSRNTLASRPRITIPSPNHPIYGSSGIMRGIVIARSPHQSYRLDPSYPRRSCKVFGHNDTSVGQWWPTQLCALRDGAHGHIQGGISGTEAAGAFSIVISGMYSDLDRDFGATVYYSGSDAHANTDPETPKISNATKTLRRNLDTGNAVRVLRSSQGGWAGRPSVGIRYDGLYAVVEEKVRKNCKGGAYVRFLLEREDGQERIEKWRPSSKERREFEKVVDGYH
ncbi:MAG: hypothetical protein Q9190_005080 [Brigantiaea leucoxantha]